jgi:hypothetical protein
MSWHYSVAKVHKAGKTPRRAAKIQHGYFLVVKPTFEASVTSMLPIFFVGNMRKIVKTEEAGKPLRPNKYGSRLAI